VSDTRQPPAALHGTRGIGRVVQPDVRKSAPRRWGRGCLLAPGGAASGKLSVWGVSPAKQERPMPDKNSDTIIATVSEQLVAEGPEAMMAQAIRAPMNLALRMEREPFLGAGHYQRAAERRG